MDIVSRDGLYEASIVKMETGFGRFWDLELEQDGKLLFDMNTTDLDEHRLAQQGRPAVAVSGGIFSVGHFADEFDGDDPYPSLEMIDHNTAVVQFSPRGDVYVVNVDEVLEELDEE